MPNKSTNRTTPTIYESLKNIFSNFLGDSEEVDFDLYEWASEIRLGRNGKEMGDPVDRATSFNFVDEKNKNYGLQQELKESFNQMYDYMHAGNRAGGSIDYDEWNQKITQNLPAFKEKLDTFNEATNYDYINTPEMRVLNNILNRMNAADITVQNCEYSEPLVDMKLTAGRLEEDFDELKDVADEYIAYCKMNDLNANTIEKELKAYSQIENQIENISFGGNKEIEKLKQYKEELGKERQFEQAFKETAALLVDKKLSGIKQNELGRQEMEFDSEEIANWIEVPAKLENAVNSLKQLAGFQRDNDVKSPKYVIDFIKVDPEYKEDILTESEFDAYKQKIQKMNPQQLEQYIADATAEHKKTIDGFKGTEYQSYIDTFQKGQELKEKSIKQEQKAHQIDSNLSKSIQKLEELNKGLKNPENIKERLKNTMEKINKLSKDELKETKESIMESYKRGMKPSGKMNALDNVIESRQKMYDFCKNNKTKMAGIAYDIRNANTKREVVVEKQKAINAKLEGLRSKTNIVPPETRVKNSTQAYLDKFATQFDKCTRLGHVNSEAFTNMQTALKNAQKDATPENLKAMKEAADAYMEARKNDHSLFATKMRRHRLDLAKSISDFGEACSKMDYTLNYAKEAKNAADNAVNSTSKDVLKDKSAEQSVTNKKSLKKQIGNYLDLNKKIQESEEKLKEIESKKKVINNPVKSEPKKKPVEKSEPAANMI